MVFRRLRKRGRDRAKCSERRRLGKAFQKDGPTTAKPYIGALQEKVYPQRKFTTVMQLKLAIIDDTEVMGSALLIANEWCPVPTLIKVVEKQRMTLNMFSD